MEFFVHVGTLILSAYLATTNSLAYHIENIFTKETAVPEVTNKITDSSLPTPLTHLESTFADGFSIPDVLLTNPAFQSANALSSAPNNSAITHNPAEAMVNIYCTYTTDTHIRATTGSGYFISREGAILTNAHVAQFLLLEDANRAGETECVLRVGSPATSTYEAKLLYIPPAWIQANAELIDAESPSGTGERDYALLYASGRLDNQPLPATFKHLAINTKALSVRNEGMSITAFGYPATPLMEGGLTANLLLEQADTNISILYTFAGETADLIAMPDSAVSRTGSSGGAVVNDINEAIGVIVTKGEAKNDNLRALTLAYVNRTIKEETGFGLAEYTSGDLAFKANTFQSALAPFLTSLLEFALEEESEE